MRTHLRLISVVLLVIAMLVVIQVSGLRHNFNVAFVHNAFLAHKLGGVLLFVLLFSLGNLAQLPGLVFLAAAVFALGQVWGGVVTFIAANISCLITFLVFRYLGGDALLHLKSPLARRALQSLHARPVRSVVVLRTLFQTLPALNVTLAISGMRPGPYLLGTFAGLVAPIALYCVFFEYLARSLNLH